MSAASAAADPLLDAAREVFEQYGVRRANIDDIARRSGVSRSTLYRRYATKQALLEAVLMEVYEEFLAELDAVAADLAAQEAVVECFWHGLQLTRRVPLLVRLAETDPETFTGTSARSHGAMLRSSAQRVARTLRRSGATMAEDDLLLVSETMLRLASTYLVDPAGRLDITDELAVRDYAKRYLAPLVE